MNYLRAMIRDTRHMHDFCVVDFYESFCIGAAICTHKDISCFLYAGFSIKKCPYWIFKKYKVWKGAKKISALTPVLEIILNLSKFVNLVHNFCIQSFTQQCPRPHNKGALTGFITKEEVKSEGYWFSKSTLSSLMPCLNLEERWTKTGGPQSEQRLERRSMVRKQRNAPQEPGSGPGNVAPRNFGTRW